mmetsp:Transcript_6050/g.13336  ORF Transcript_6050/g.13336 Transcript_6050/m.13336 type:complete len:438 (-) Transcript_6050:188-1501(-)
MVAEENSRGEAAPAATTSTSDTPIPLARSAASFQWELAASKFSMLLRTSVSVADENKIGVVPEGELRRVVDALHSSLGRALKGDAPSGGFPRVTLSHPAVFAEFRKVIGIPDAAFYASLALQSGRERSDMRSIPVSQASGKSRSFFFLSPDQHYIFKSAGVTEIRTLHRIAPSYVQHFRDHPHSLLPRYVAVVQLHMREHETIHFIVMCNALGGVRPIHWRYDIKGSTHQRLASQKERQKKHPVFKDQDWLRDGRQLVFSCADDPKDYSANAKHLSIASSRNGFVHALRKDADFLRRMLLIDYSLLVGVHECNSATAVSKVEQTPGLAALITPDAVTYVCLIDILTSYGMRKVCEHFFMGTLFGCRDISCQPPRVYSQRFMRFIDMISVVRERRYSAGTKAVGGEADLARPQEELSSGPLRLEETSDSIETTTVQSI